MDPLLEQFLQEARENLAFIDQHIEEIGGDDPELLNSIFRAAHTLKGGAATALYGLRAANGALIITTKSGKKNSKTKFTYNSFYSVQETSNTLDLMNATEYAVYVGLYLF